jgi:hypothetical protein
MNPGRSTPSSTERTLTGLPAALAGNGSETTLRCASSGSMKIAARTTAFAAPGVPEGARSEIARPKGAPRYGPVSDAVPSSVNGVVPSSAPAVTAPTREALPHVPVRAWASGQSATPLSVPSRPGGSSTVSPARCGCPSGRATAG